jgi:hypothetical protein
VIKLFWTYILHLLIAIDQLVTALVGGFPDETLSSYAYRMDQQHKPWGRFWRPIIDWLFAWQKLPGGHCMNARNSERARLELPPELREGGRG